MAAAWRRFSRSKSVRDGSFTWRPGYGYAFAAFQGAAPDDNGAGGIYAAKQELTVVQQQITAGGQGGGDHPRKRQRRQVDFTALGQHEGRAQGADTQLRALHINE